MTRRYGFNARGDEPVDLSYVWLETETEAAWLVVFRVKTETLPLVREWLPKSQCDLDADRRVVAAPRWLVEKRNLEDFAQ